MHLNSSYTHTACCYKLFKSCICILCIMFKVRMDPDRDALCHLSSLRYSWSEYWRAFKVWKVSCLVKLQSSNPKKLYSYWMIPQLTSNSNVQFQCRKWCVLHVVRQKVMVWWWLVVKGVQLSWGFLCCHRSTVKDPLQTNKNTLLNDTCVLAQGTIPPVVPDWPASAWTLQLHHHWVVERLNEWMNERKNVKCFAH